MIRQKYLDSKKEYQDNKKEQEKTKKYNFQGQSAGSKRWFDLDHEWLEEIFITSTH